MLETVFERYGGFATFGSGLVFLKSCGRRSRILIDHQTRFVALVTGAPSCTPTRHRRASPCAMEGDEAALRRCHCSLREILPALGVAQLMCIRSIGRFRIASTSSAKDTLRADANHNF